MLNAKVEFFIAKNHQYTSMLKLLGINQHKSPLVDLYHYEAMHNKDTLTIILIHLSSYDRSRLCTVNHAFAELCPHVSMNMSPRPDLYTLPPTYLMTQNTYLQIIQDYHLFVRCKCAIIESKGAKLMIIPSDPNVAACMMLSIKHKKYRSGCAYVHMTAWENPDTGPTSHILSKINYRKYAKKMNSDQKLYIDAMCDHIEIIQSYFEEHVPTVNIINIVLLNACIGDAINVVNYICTKYKQYISYGVVGATIVGNIHLANYFHDNNIGDNISLFQGACINGDITVINYSYRYPGKPNNDTIYEFLINIIMYNNIAALEYFVKLSNIPTEIINSVVSRFGHVDAVKYVISRDDFTREMCKFAIKESKKRSNYKVCKYYIKWLKNNKNTGSGVVPTRTASAMVNTL